MENRPWDPRWGAGREPQQPATRQSPPCRGGMGHCPCDMHLSGRAAEGGPALAWSRAAHVRRELRVPGAQPPAFSGAPGSAKQGDLRAAPSFCSLRGETDHFYFDRKGIGDPGIVGILLFACTCLCLALSAFRHLSDTVLGSGFQSHRKKTQCLSKLSLWLVLSTMATATTGAVTIQQSLV